MGMFKLNYYWFKLRQLILNIEIKDSAILFLSQPGGEH